MAIFGLGGVGLASVLGAAVASAWPIIAVAPVPAKRELARQLGATAVFSPEEAEKGVKDLTGGGAEFTFEAAGVPPEARSRSIDTRRARPS